MSDRRILVVDDFEGFRRFVSSTLHQRAGLQVVGQASDGLEALQKAKELQPDLVLLDIGLPKLNGLETAKRLRLFAPDAKILFISQESSSDVAQETFRVGAKGYVHKPGATRDLVPAVEAVLEGKQFLSRSLRFGDWTDAPRGHEVQFYSADAGFVHGFTECVHAALKGDNAAIVLATKPHRERLVQMLKEEGLNIDAAIERGTFIQLDAAYILSTIMVDGAPENGRFFDGLGRLIASTSVATKKENPRIAICGECGGLLCAGGNARGAIQLEEVGKDLLQMYNVDIMCAYPLSDFHGGENDPAFKSIRAQHTAAYS